VDVRRRVFFSVSGFAIIIRSVDGADSGFGGGGDGGNGTRIARRRRLSIFDISEKSADAHPPAGLPFRLEAAGEWASLGGR